MKANDPFPPRKPASAGLARRLRSCWLYALLAAGSAIFAWPFLWIRLGFEDQLADEPWYVALAEQQKAEIGRQGALVRPAEVDFGRFAGFGEFQGDGGDGVCNGRTFR